MSENSLINNNNNNNDNKIENHKSKSLENFIEQIRIISSQKSSQQQQQQKNQTSTNNDEIIENLVSNIYEEYFSDIFEHAIKTESDIQIDINKYEYNTALQTPSKTKATNKDIWIFGYGSLIWKADFPFVTKQPGYIKGFHRRFYQNSLDHRGTPEKPGRVVTLIPSTNTESKVWGMAYRVSHNVKNDVLEHLDYREKNGYERFPVKFYPYNPNKKNNSSFNTTKTTKNDANNINIEKNENKNAIDIIVYVATKDNDSYVGHIDNLDKIAEQIYTSKGSSGTNREYVYKLANSIRSLFPNQTDDHLFTLESKLRQKEEWDLDMSKNIRYEIHKKIHEIIDNNLLMDTHYVEIFINDLKMMIKDKSKMNSSTSLNGIDLIEKI